MKKILFILSCILVLASCSNPKPIVEDPKKKGTEQKEKEKEEELSPYYKAFDWDKMKTTDYTFTDLDGNKYNIKEILASGKKILIDFSATWCKWCWIMHKGGMLEQAVKNFGANGIKRQDLVVLWVEAEGADESKIEASYKNWTVKYNTDEKVPYPVISDGSAARIMGLKVKGLPSLFFISPRGEAFNLMDYFNLFIIGQYSSFNLKSLEKLINACPKK